VEHPARSASWRTVGSAMPSALKSASALDSASVLDDCPPARVDTPPSPCPFRGFDGLDRAAFVRETGRDWTAALSCPVDRVGATGRAVDAFAAVPRRGASTAER